MTPCEWQPLSLFQKNNEFSLPDWMMQADSMTATMKLKFGKNFYLKLLSQSKQYLTTSEASLLKMPVSQPVMVRVVEMGGVKPCLWGRAILTEKLLSGETAKPLLQLGEKPLGEVLFQDPTLVRTEFEIAKIFPDQAEARWIQAYSVHWPVTARRSLFYFFKKPLLLTEVFLEEEVLEDE